MDKFKRAMEEDLQQKELKNILNNKDLGFYRKQVSRLAVKLEVDILDYAAALVCYMEQERNSGRSLSHGKEKTLSEKVRVEMPFDIKMVRYRLEVGREHQVSVDDVKKVLIEEAGVEKSRIGQIDLHNNYCIVSLPSGMPTDIFFHLKKVSMNQQELKINRLNGRNRNSRRKAKQRGGRKGSHNVKKDSFKKGQKE